MLAEAVETLSPSRWRASAILLKNQRLARNVGITPAPRVSPCHVLEKIGENGIRATRATEMARAIDFASKYNSIALARTRARQIDKSIWSAGAALFGASPASKSWGATHAQR